MRWNWMAAALIGALALSTGCKHTVEIRSTPEGATVSKNGVPLGKTPLLYEEQLGPKEAQRFQVEVSGVERELSVERGQLQMSGVGIGALVGCLGCCLYGSAVAAVANFFPPAGFAGLLGPLLPIAGAIVGWMQFGYFSPDTIDMDLRTGETQAFPAAPVTLGDPLGDKRLPPPAAPDPDDAYSKRAGTPATDAAPPSPADEAPPAPAADTPPADENAPPPPHTDPAYGATPIDDDEYGVIPPNPPPVTAPAEPADPDDDDSGAEEIGEDGFGAPIAAPDEDALRF